jgi:hypothetical protein
LSLLGNNVVYAETAALGTDEYGGECVELCRSFATKTCAPIVLFVGTPSYRMYHRFVPGLGKNEFQLVFFKDYGGLMEVANSYWIQAATMNKGTGVFEFSHDERIAKKSFGSKFVGALRAGGLPHARSRHRHRCCWGHRDPRSEWRAA